MEQIGQSRTKVYVIKFRGVPVDVKLYKAEAHKEAVKMYRDLSVNDPELKVVEEDFIVEAYNLEPLEKEDNATI